MGVRWSEGYVPGPNGPQEELPIFWQLQNNSASYCAWIPGELSPPPHVQGGSTFSVDHTMDSTSRMSWSGPV